MHPNSVNFSKAEFIKSAVEEKDFPALYLGKSPYPEIAVIGRSNAGKSSLINHLTQRKNLVYVSSTPGKTQLINFFSVDDKLLLVDLPGYGFAKADREMRKTWGTTLANYLENRPQLKLLILILDSRRDLSEDDKMMIEWAKATQKPVLFILSKTDKLNSAEKVRAEKRLIESLSEFYPVASISYVFYSIKDSGCRLLLQNKICSSKLEN